MIIFKFRATHIQRCLAVHCTVRLKTGYIRPEWGNNKCRNNNQGSFLFLLVGQVEGCWRKMKSWMARLMDGERGAATKEMVWWYKGIDKTSNLWRSETAGWRSEVEWRKMVIGPPTTYYSNLRIWKCNFDDDDDW